MKHATVFSPRVLIIALFIMIIVLAPQPKVAQAAEIRPIVFPVLGTVSYRDDFGEPRTDHTHEGNDIMAAKMRPLIATVDGVVNWVQYPEPDWGYAIALRDSEGYRYWYLHVNNDNPGTDDGLGGGLNAYALDIINGATVVKGQQIGWVGDSGNAESAGPHLHFEIHTPDGTPFSPFASLQAAVKITVPVEEPKQPNEILPYGNFKGGATMAVGNFGGEAVIVTGAGPGGGPHVEVMKKDGIVISSFFPYPPLFKGGVDVAAGDIDGDGIDEIITGAGPGGGPHVRIFTANGQPRGSFFAYSLSFRGGVRVAVGDINNDDKAEIITGAGPGGGPHVRIFKADGTVVGGFMAYAPTFRGGVDVALKQASLSSAARIITSALPSGGPHVRTFDILGNPEASFFAYDVNFRGGVKVSAANINPVTGEFDIITVPASIGGPDIRLFSSLGVLTNSFKAFEPWWRGGYEVEATDKGSIYISANGRRASIRIAGSSSNYNSNPYNFNPDDFDPGSDLTREHWWRRGD
ncbi:hypothetical protein COV49_04560 [Candidatus Falkowbacteria bacterium CG11_big_fil_rev_8_21_14_0_20_39_10]|uniref:M23ase beta-sheet core domain-containing protein n=1 Tax=Candidatus Falkowbacteria bacterium CG11_big_fil_rev_8_21_14_0_20_39_10 TaxID=1974570 RepID=A0A2M6K7U7_9BACT|nr:MAG: hypothetical protein COV49_04560 [Candidatus Falkowbacteria bacterium CG11_big_fil_rev_8_21_14_0_20_39_10]